MGERWWFIDTRYFSLSFTYESANDLELGRSLVVWILDISVRPLFIIHIAVAWAAFLRCANFVFLCTPFPDFSYKSDIFETDESCIYPLSNAPPFSDFARFLWKSSIFRFIRAVKMAPREIYVAIKMIVGLPIPNR